MPEIMDRVKTKINVKSDLKEPTTYSILYHNDNATSFEFVVSTLMQFFGYSIENAVKMAAKIHEEKKSIVADGFTEELAVYYKEQIDNLSKANNFPLQVEVIEDK
jgi:ATP-dependent Clp protease adaptor protein ClpS